MRSYAPAIVVCLLGVALMLVGVAGWVTSPPSLAHHEKPTALVPVTIAPSNLAGVPVSFSTSGSRIVRASLLSRGGRAT